jgi:predicted RNA-binding protein with PIN domain
MSHIIIDGYNLLAQSSYQSREELLKELKAFQKAGSHQVTVFFDGTHQGTGTGDKYMEEYIEIIFSPLTVTADEMIEEFLETNYKSNMVIVSSDRRIQKAAIAKRLSFLESKEFLFKLKYISPSGKKTSMEKPWMEGRTTEEEDNRPAKKGGNPRKKSKRGRQKQRTLKKL